MIPSDLHRVAALELARTLASGLAAMSIAFAAMGTAFARSAEAMLGVATRMAAFDDDSHAVSWKETAYHTGEQMDEIDQIIKEFTDE